MIQVFVFIGIFLSALSSASAADPMGRLFFTPAQRAQLETARAQRDRRAPVPTAETEKESEAAPPAPQGPEIVTYNGIVRRSDGKSTVWINGKAITERNRDESSVSVLGVRRDGAVSIAVPQADRSASLRVGQSVEVMSGTIEESYARRATIPRMPVEKPVATPSATDGAKPPPAAVAAPADAAKKAARRDTRDFDPESGAMPATERVGKK